MICTMKWGPLVLGLTIFVIMLGSYENAWPLNIDSRQQIEFADELFNHRQYRRAGEEYQRFTFFFPDAPQRRQMLFKAGQSFYLAQDPATALEHFKELTADGLIDALAVDAHFMSVECHLQMGSATQAMVQLHNIVTLSNDPAVQDRAYYRLGWIHIDQVDWPSAQRSFDRISLKHRRRYKLDDLDDALGRANDLPHKIPALAGTLSIIPGAGQLYCQRYEDALIAFAVNLGLFWAAHDAFDQDQYALGSLLTFVGLGFYSGNIYGAVTDAHKYNQSQQRRHRDQLNRYLTLRFEPTLHASAQGVIFSLHFRF